MASNGTKPSESSNSIYRVFTLEEISKHSSANDLWISLHGRVYDVTSYVPSHPGHDLILDGAGKDATELFEEIGHSDKARTILKQFYIGDLVKDSS
jgi:cytochrome b involved in lipid metabolism